MDTKINVLGIEVNNCTAKEAMESIAGYLQEEPMSLVEVVTADSVMRMSQNETVRGNLEQMDLIMPGDKAILEAVEVSDKKKLQEADQHTFIKLLLSYLHRNNTRVFLLADTEADMDELRSRLENRYKSIEVVGAALVTEQQNDTYDMIINQVNGAEAQCIIASVSSENQEAFVCRCKKVLNVRLWIGISRTAVSLVDKENLIEHMFTFAGSKILKRKVIKEKKKRNA
mgnify:FL=1